MPVLVLVFLLLCIQLIPPLPVYLNIIKTLAAGTIAVSGLAMALSLITAEVFSRTRREPFFLDLRINGFFFVILLITAVCIHGAIASRLIPMNYLRFVLSLIPLFFLTLGAVALGTTLRSATPAELHTASWFCYWCLICIVVMRLLALEPRASAFTKPMFPFTETSHFVLVFGPIYLYRSVVAPLRHKLLWVAFGLALALLLKSATMIAFAFGAALLCRRLAVLLLSTALVIIAGASSHLTYFTSRADITSHSSNLSALVFLQGWEFILRSLIVSHGWGLGFQQLGLHSLHLPVSRLIRRLTNGKDLNAMGGSFVFSKLASEFGIFGIAAGVAYLIYALRSIRILRNTKSFGPSTFSRCIIVGFGVDMFIRGTGYFYGEALFFLGALVSLAPQYELLRHGVSRAGQKILALR